MPDRDVETIRDLIFYQYAKVIARRAFSSSDGVQAKRGNYGFIKQKFRQLKTGAVSWSDITREDWQLQVIACGSCNGTKGTKGLYEFYRATHPREKKFYDFIPPLAEKKYLKTIFQCHDCAGTLMGGDIDGDGEITVLDIDRILRH